MHQIQACSNSSVFNSCSICTASHKTRDLSEITCKINSTVHKAICHTDCLRKIAFRENRGGDDFSCPICSLS